MIPPRIGLNMGMRLPSRALVVALAVIAAAGWTLAACGRSGYQYVENGDETVFVKIPEGWEVVSEGSVNYAITPDENYPQILPGERVVPWRAQFNAAPNSRRTSSEHVAGFVEVQPVDRRMRSDLNLMMLFPFDLAESDGKIEVVRHDVVTRGQAAGHRIAWRQVTEDGQEFMADQMVIADELNSVVYTVGLSCSTGCYAANATSIEEVMRTFTVQD